MIKILGTIGAFCRCANSIYNIYILMWPELDFLEYEGPERVLKV